MAKIKTEKNLLGKRDQYNAYYGDFRGVDFSNDHTQVLTNRLAYSVNMYKDYWSKQGKAIETFPGFRRAFAVDGNSSEIYGIHHLNGSVIVHMGESLYLWKNHPNTCGVPLRAAYQLKDPIETSSIEVGERTVTGKTFAIDLKEIVASNGGGIGSGACITEVLEKSGSKVLTLTSGGNNTWSFSSTTAEKGDIVYVTYYEDKATEPYANIEMKKRKSYSFVIDKDLYIIDGKNYLKCRDIGNSLVISPVGGLVPKRYTGIIPAGEAANGGIELQQKNLLSEFFVNTFVADGTNKTFPLKELADPNGEFSVSLYNKPFSKFTYSESENAIVINSDADAPSAPSAAGYPDGYAGVEITARYRDAAEYADTIQDCTVGCVFDNRIFLSGNPNYPNRVWFSTALNGVPNPAYFGADNFFDDGVGLSPVTGMISVADTLMVLKESAEGDGAIYFHSPVLTEDEVVAKTYSRVKGLSGVGCVGACTNFLDDPVFVSKLGLEAMGTLSVRYERAVEHRSSLVDAQMANMDLSHAFIEEWNGYLFLFVDGDVFLADSRQRYTDDLGVMQYEWYYLSGIGVYEGQYESYTYSKDLPAEDISVKVEGSQYILHVAKDKVGKEANPNNEKVYSETVDGEAYHFVIDGGWAYLCETKGNFVGGEFKPATTARTIDGNLFFGTKNGVICQFNFDKRDEYGEISPRWYSYDNRAIPCGCATKMDSCGIPHLTKSTVKKSMVVKTKSMQTSALKVKVRTNKDPYKQIARISSTLFSFDNMDFEDFSFTTTEESLFTVREKEKKWVEKQIYIYSDEYLKPFALYYIAFRYVIAGRYKQ